LSLLGWISLIVFIVQAGVFGAFLHDLYLFEDIDRSSTYRNCDQPEILQNEMAHLNCLDSAGATYTTYSDKRLPYWIGLAAFSAMSIGGIVIGRRQALRRTRAE
jgi:hypothetical protein